MIHALVHRSRSSVHLPVSSEAAALARARALAAGSSEAVVLATCLRSEAYLTAQLPPCSVAEWGLPFDPMTGTAGLTGTDAVRHLFEVAAGIDSEVVGETEILGQVRDAARQAPAGTELAQLFRRAVQVSKHVRARTKIAVGVVALHRAATAMMRERLGTLDGERAVVVGAGQLGRGMAWSLRKAGAAVTVVNRDSSRGSELARLVDGDYLAFADLGRALEKATIACFALKIPEALSVPEDLPEATIDLGAPSNLTPGRAMFDLEAVWGRLNESLAARRDEIPRARALIDAEVQRYLEENG